MAAGLAQRLGISPPDFWRLTPWEFQLRLDDYSAAERAASDERVYCAWVAGVVATRQKPPKLKSLLLSHKAPPKPKGIDEAAIRERFASLRRGQGEAVH